MPREAIGGVQIPSKPRVALQTGVGSWIRNKDEQAIVGGLELEGLRAHNRISVRKSLTGGRKAHVKLWCARQSFHGRLDPLPLKFCAVSCTVGWQKLKHSSKAAKAEQVFGGV